MAFSATSRISTTERLSSPLLPAVSSRRVRFFLVFKPKEGAQVLALSLGFLTPSLNRAQCRTASALADTCAGDLRTLTGEGMPKYKDPYEKGRLIIQFKVNFPKPGFATPEQLAQLEKLLPPRQPLPMQSPEAEERVLEDFDIERLQREQQVCCCVAFFEHVSSFSFFLFHTLSLN